MDDTVLLKLKEKADEFASHASEARQLADSIGKYDKNSDMGCAMAGIMAGRLYNAFYYQTRRILHRDPTPLEFEEFLKFVSDNVPAAVSDSG